MVLTADMLGAFVKVAETLSVSAAAIELGVGKGLISKRIAQLEALVGATLFSRSSRRVSLTPAGEAYLDGARRALAEMAAAQERVRDLRAQLSGEIRMTATVSWGQHVLARLLPEFLRLHPGVSIELQLADRLMELARERIDLALRWTSAPAPPGLATVAVADVEWVLAAAPAYLDGVTPPRDPQDLVSHPCVGYWRETGDDQWRFARTAGGERRQVRVAGRYRANNAESVTAAARAGLGIALLPTYLCADALRCGELVRVLDDWTPITRFGTRITAVGPPERIGLARVSALLGFLRQRGQLRERVPTSAEPAAHHDPAASDLAA